MTQSYDSVAIISQMGNALQINRRDPAQGKASDVAPGECH
jgi:hypothetical protein